MRFTPLPLEPEVQSNPFLTDEIKAHPTNSPRFTQKLPNWLTSGGLRSQDIQFRHYASKFKKNALICRIFSKKFLQHVDNSYSTANVTTYNVSCFLKG